MYKLKNWSVIYKNGLFNYSDQKRYLSGEIYGCNEPREIDGRVFQDGKRIKTSSIVKVEGRIVTTYSGSQYELENPSEEYLAWCLENSFEIDPSNPIKLK